MSTNPIKAKIGSTSTVRSGRTALEWAQIARDRHDLKGAELWEQAHREGWDAEHYDPAVREYHEKEAIAWAAKKGVFTNRRHG